MFRNHIFVDIIVFSLFFSVYATESVEDYKQENDYDIRDQFLELSKRMQVLELRDKEQQEEIYILKARGNEQPAEISILKARGNEQQAEIKNLKREVLAYQQQTSVLKHLVERLTDVPENSDNESVFDAEGSATNKQIMNSATKLINDRKNNGQRIRRYGNAVNVAFFAVLHKHVLHNVVGQNIVFDNVITNDGSAYSNTSGAFVAPVDGTYVFSADIMAFVSETEHYWLVKNGQVVRSMYVKADSAPYVSTGVTAVLKLNTGDNIEIETGDLGGSAHGSLYSSFAGFLLHQDNGALVVVGK